MKFKPIPLFYAANEHFKNTLRFAVEFNDTIDLAALKYAVEQVQIRYPYFSVKVERDGEELVLADNNLPYVIAAGEKPVCVLTAMKVTVTYWRLRGRIVPFL